MNIEALTAKLNAAQALLDEVRTELNTPDTPPPPPAPDAPTFNTPTVYGNESGLVIEFNITFPEGATPLLDYKAAHEDTTGHGPQEWNELQATGTPNVSLYPTRDRILVFRARAMNGGGTSEPALLTVNLNDYLPAVEA